MKKYICFFPQTPTFFSPSTPLYSLFEPISLRLETFLPLSNKLVVHQCSGPPLLPVLTWFLRSLMYADS